MADQDTFLQRALLEEGLVDKDQLTKALQYCNEYEVDLVDALVQTETLTSRDIALTRADLCEVPYVELTDYEPCFSNVSIVPRNVADRHCVYPLFMVDGVMTVAMDDPLNLEAADQIRHLSGCEVDMVLCDRYQIRALISRAYSLGHNKDDKEQTNAAKIEVSVEDDGASQPVVAAVNQMLADAAQAGASDIHINPDEHELHLRYRIDGVLQEKQGPPLSMHTGIVQRLKVMSNLDLTQTRRPQDGKFRFKYGNQNVDVRLSTIPTVCGENVVMRLLAQTQNFKDFRELGIDGNSVHDLEQILSYPHGMMLVTGPTGSGKTTTLYTAIGLLNDPSRNIMTIEDPVEIRLPYVRQVQVNSEIGMTFAGALRSILRQDPDVVLVGEIRDNETATIALQAALTGHMVLSTLHTNDAVGAIARLRDYGLPSFVINSSVLGVIAQRLVRRVCAHCAQPDEIDPLMRRRFMLDDDIEGFVKGKGCSRCGQTGYRGRVGVYELLKFTPEIKRIVEVEGSTDEITRIAVSDGMRLMWQDGMEKARMGLTTLEEVAKVASVVEVDQIAQSKRLSA